MFLRQLCLVAFLCMKLWVISQEDSTTCDISCICLGDISPAGIMISHVHPKKEWMLSYRYMQMGMGEPIHGNSSTTALDVYSSYLAYNPSMKMDMHMVMGMVGISDRLTGMVMFHYIQNSMPMEIFGNHIHTMSGMTMSANTSMEMRTSGMGDVKLHALYGIVKNRTTQVVLSLGASLPIGTIYQKGSQDDMFYAGTRLPYMMQLGSGTWDLLPGITFVTQKNAFALSTQVLGNLHLNKNNVGYRFGNEISANIWFGYNWWKGFGSTIRIEGSTIDKIDGFDKTIYAYNEIAANPINYGGTRIQGLVGLTYQFEKGFIANHRVAVEFGLPLYQNVNGFQNKLKQTWMASWSYSF